MKKILVFIVSGLILSGCAQSTAMLGPAITLASSGNVSQAGLTFITNKAVEKETGMDTVSFVSNKIEQQNSKTRLKRDFKKLVQNNIYFSLELSSQISSTLGNQALWGRHQSLLKSIKDIPYWDSKRLKDSIFPLFNPLNSFTMIAEPDK